MQKLRMVELFWTKYLLIYFDVKYFDIKMPTRYHL
jgi:hypothetical protein